MISSLRKLLTGTLLLLSAAFCTAAHAQTNVTVLRLAPPGAGTAMWADALAESLQKNNYMVTVKGFNSCQEGRAWVKNNPTEPVVFASFSDYAILDLIDPSHPAACGFELDETTLVTVVGKWWNFICGRTGQASTIEGLRNNPDAKITVWNHPVSSNVARAHMKALGTEAKIVPIASGKDMMAAFVAQDVDYIIISSEYLAETLPNAQCFASSIPENLREQYMPNRTSYEQVADIPFKGYGNWPYITSYNISNEQIRTVLTDNPGELQQKLMKSFVPVTAPVAEQMKDLRSIADGLKDVVK